MKRIQRQEKNGRQTGRGGGGGNPGAEPDNVEVIEIHHHHFHNRFGHMIAEECALDSYSLCYGVTALLQKVGNLLLLQQVSLSQDAPLERDELPSLYGMQKSC